MKAYVLCIIIALFFTLIADFFFKNKKNKLGKVFLFFSLITTCLIAGVRSELVGTDIRVYLKGLYVGFTNNSLNIFSAIHTNGIEPLFSVVVFLTSKFKDLHFVLFFLSAICSLPIYYYSYLQKEKTSCTLNVFIYLVTIYCYSFNLLRQSIAITFLILGAYYFYNNSTKKAIIMQILAFLFHYSSIISIIIYGTIFVIKRRNKKNIVRLFFLITAFIIAITVFYKALPYLNIKYSSYITQDKVTSFNISSLLKKILWLIPISIALGKSKEEEVRNKLLLSTIFVIFDIVLYIFGLKLPILSRMGLYFLNCSYFIFIPNIKYGFKQKKIITICLCFILSLYWWHMTCVENDSSNVYPYYSDVIEILN